MRIQTIPGSTIPRPARTVLLLTFMLLLASTGVRAEDCAPLHLITEVQMLSGNGGYRWMVPVTINGAPKLMRLGTAALFSSLSPDAVKDLNIKSYDTGQDFRTGGYEMKREVNVDSFQIGTLKAERKNFLVSAEGMSDLDGILSTGFLLNYDIDIDFGTGRLKYFSPDHCPGKVVYWSPPSVTGVPITIPYRDLVRIPVTLDGQTFNAILDTASPNSFISDEAARLRFKLDSHAPDMQKIGNLDGKENLPIFGHVFHTLSFGGVEVSHPKMVISPAIMDRGRLPDLILGTNILRQLHVYMAFKENRFYISAGSPPREHNAEIEDVALIEKAITLSPMNPALLNQSCFLHGRKKLRLEETLLECDRALSMRPRDPYFMDSKGLVLYQLGRYQDALDTYNQVLAIDPKHAASLYMRGHAKKRLGDAASGDADIAAAKVLNGGIEAQFKDSGLAGD